MANPYFPLIIDFWCNIAGRYGLSFPFLVGAEQLMTGRDDYSINTLLEELKDSYQSYVISYCDDLDEYIVGLHRREYPNLLQLKKINGLAINNDTLEGLDTLEELDAFLSNLYAGYIAEGNFSKNYDTQHWECFTSDDLKMIEMARLT